MTQLPKDIKLELDYFEFGVLYASIKDEVWDRMPRRLYLLLKIYSLEAYVKHPAFKKSDRRQLAEWRKELQNIKGGQDVKKSK